MTTPRRDTDPGNMIGKGYYRDTGCPGGCDKSLECPLPKCLEDQNRINELRDAEITTRRMAGVPVADLMIEYGLKRRQFTRIANAAKEQRATP